MKTPKLERDLSLNLVIIHKLRDLGVPANIKGYDYLKEALGLVLGDPELLGYITKGLYPSIAKEYGTTTTRVERAIRPAIEVTFDRSRPDDIRAYFGNSYSPMKGKPTNSEFIATLAELIREEVGVYGGKASEELDGQLSIQGESRV